MSISIDYYVLRLQISIENPLGMKMRDRCKGFQEIKFGLLLFHPSNFSQKIEKLTSIAVFHAKYEIILSFKAGIEFSDERMPRTSLKDGPLALDYILFLILHDKLLTDSLQGH